MSRPQSFAKPASTDAFISEIGDATWKSLMKRVGQKNDLFTKELFINVFLFAHSTRNNKCFTLFHSFFLFLPVASWFLFRMYECISSGSNKHSHIHASDTTA